jgi:hypothetical protein
MWVGYNYDSIRVIFNQEDEAKIVATGKYDLHLRGPNTPVDLYDLNFSLLNLILMLSFYLTHFTLA